MREAPGRCRAKTANLSDAGAEPAADGAQRGSGELRFLSQWRSKRRGFELVARHDRAASPRAYPRV